MRHLRLPYQGNHSTRIILLGFILLVTSCTPADFVFKCRGRIVDDSNIPYDVCILELKQNNQHITTVKVNGIFKQTFVFPPVSGAPVEILISCDGTHHQHQVIVNKFPSNFESYIEIGDIQLSRKIKVD